MKTTKMLAILVLRSELLRRVALVLALGLMVCQAKVSEAAEMGTAFTYQGHLYDANHVADGLYDFAFKLYDANVGGSKAGTDVNVADVDVIDGYFTVELDFGDVYDGNGVWLEIGVRAGELEDPNVYTTLSPRQRITPTPYALYATAATSLSAADGTPANVVYVDEVGNVGISTMSPGAKLDVAGNQNIRGDLNFSELLSTIGFANDGQINLNGDLMVTSGLSGSIGAGASMELEAGSTMDLRSAAGMTITTPLLDIAAPVDVQSNLTVDGNVGIGTTSPGAKLHVVGDAEITGGLEVTNDISGGFGTSITPRIAFGNNADASGGYGAMAVGFNATATGTVAMALGQGVTASGYDAKAIGRNTTASGQCSTAMGHSITAQGNYSFGIGLDGTSSTVTADNTMAIMGGNVGIGITNPDEKLTVDGTIKSTTSATDGRAVYAEASNSGDVTNYGGYFSAAGGTGKGIWGEASQTGDFVNHGGYFRANGTYGRGVQGESFGSGGQGVFGYATGSDGRGVWGCADGSDGVGVYGRARGSYGIAVEGNGEQYDFYASGPGTDYGTSSSIRWKSDVRAIDDPLGKILRLRGVYFNWDAEHGGGHDVGMIAEEVGEVLPEIVMYEENGVDAIGMDYSKVTPLLVEVVKELKIESDQRDAEKDVTIERLRQENLLLSERLVAIETLVADLTALQKRGEL